MSGYGKKEIRILPKPKAITVDVQMLMTTSVFTVNLNERKFIHVGCEWSKACAAYKQAVLIICATACLRMEHDKFIGLLATVDNLIKIMSDGATNDSKRTFIPIQGLTIKRTRCFSNSYLIIEYAGSRVSLTRDNLIAIRQQREIMFRSVTEKGVISEMLTEQCKALINAIKTEVIIRYLTVPIQGIYNMIIKWPINLLPKQKHPFYKELLVYDHSRIVTFIWDEYLRTLTDTMPQDDDEDQSGGTLHTWDYQRLFDDDNARLWNDDGDACDENVIKSHMNDVSDLVDQIDEAATSTPIQHQNEDVEMGHDI